MKHIPKSSKHILNSLQFLKSSQHISNFEIFTTHSPQDPKCWQRKRNGYAAPPSSLDAMFCSTYGQQLQESFVFCLKCELELAANVAQESCDVDSQKNIIETYLLAGFDYDTIDSFLERLVVSKTKHSKTKTEARSTQISKTRHPKLEDGAPKTRKRSTQI